MKIKKFNFKRDYERCIQFLIDCYQENKNMSCWLPQRFDDFIFRIGNMERHKKSIEFIYLFEEKDKIVGLIAPDGETFNSCIKNGYEYISSHEEIINKYGYHIVMCEKMPELMWETMGCQMYTACFDTKNEVDEFINFIHKRKIQV